MGIFATYNGFIYNEFFAIPLEIFGSCYGDEIVVAGNEYAGLDKEGKPIYNPKELAYQREENCVYSFGVDPRWFESD